MDWTVVAWQMVSEEGNQGRAASTHTSIIRHRARMALGLKTISVLPPVSFIIVLVTIIVSSAEAASSLMTRCTICRKAASLFWNSFEMPKKRVVASFAGNFSPV